MRKLSERYQKGVLSVLKYFAFFEYAPTFDQMYTFFPEKVDRDSLKKLLNQLETKKKIIHDSKQGYYALRGHSIFFTYRKQKKTITTRKLARIRRFVRLLSFFPQIELIGLSGSCSMENAALGDDVDLFIITAKERLWTGRFIAVVLAQIMRLRRTRSQKNTTDKVCLNLFFDRSNLSVPEHKKNTYIAHEIVQMRPLYIRGRALKINSYGDFIKENAWVGDILPNSFKKGERKINLNSNFLLIRKVLITNIIGIVVEYIVKKIQYSIMKPHISHEFISDTQLWFFPDDFQKKLEEV